MYEGHKAGRGSKSTSNDRHQAVNEDGNKSKGIGDDLGDSQQAGAATRQIDSSGIFHHGVTKMFEGLNAGAGSKSTGEDRHQAGNKDGDKSKAGWGERDRGQGRQ